MPFAVGMNADTDPTAVSSCLGDGKGFVMENRGILLVGASIECCISYFIRMESLCQIQLLAEAAAKGRGGELIRVGQQEVQVGHRVFRLSSQPSLRSITVDQNIMRG